MRDPIHSPIAAEKLRRLDALDERERRTLDSVATAKNVVREVIRKLHVPDRTQAAVLAVEAGLDADRDALSLRSAYRRRIAAAGRW